MVELDIQLLVGAATTVFLALIFFGVVVLWDVALALRSVGDKIDKLEDNIDDDLMDIAHALDGISNGPGNGGTQLHLSGGTISSGPQEQGQPTQGHPQGPQQAQQQAAGETAQQASQQPQAGQQPSQAGDLGAVDGENEPATPDTTEGGDGVDDLEQPTVGTEPEDDGATAESTSDEGVSESATEATEPVHPRADSNRGRFITSPDRTAWYATSLDREAIRTAQPTIAGALTDGSEAAVDESEIIAAGPVESAAPSDAIEAGGTVDTDETNPSDESIATGATEADSVDRETDESVGAEETSDSTGQETAESGESDDSTSTEANALTFEEEETAVDEDSSPPESNDASATGDGAGRDVESSGRPSTETGMEPVDETDVDVDEAESDDRSDSLRRADGDSETLESTDSDDGSELEAEDDVSSETVADEPADPFDGDVGTFEFDDDIEADVTVEAAVETINENAPAPELSSHRFDVTAEVYESEDDDRDGATLLFEFDTETVDISGSTKRLLQYQMRSFADRDSTPDGDVRIGRDRIVIEIPDSDGTDIQRWGEAAVGIIDRTLYLSDNSSDGN